MTAVFFGTRRLMVLSLCAKPVNPSVWQCAHAVRLRAGAAVMLSVLPPPFRDWLSPDQTRPDQSPAR